MPIYEFVCKKCGNPEELLVSVREAEAGKFICGKCGGKLARVFSVTAHTRTQGVDAAGAPAPPCADGGG